MKTLKTIMLVLFVAIILRTATLRAQTFTPPLQISSAGTNAVDLEFRTDGTMVAKGNSGVGTLTSGDQGVGTRLLWFPALAAFRAGNIDTWNTHVWDLGNIGQGSVAFGLDTTASGSGSVSLGSYSTASGWNSTASGYCTFASGNGSTALGGSTTASGRYSTASGYQTSASGYSSFAAGSHSSASGYGSFAAGSSAYAMGNGSAAFGTSIAMGTNSFAAGWSSYAVGEMSTASGYETVATAYLSYTLGTGNVGGGDPHNWVPTDPIFEIGNGHGVGPSDAMVVYKNGNVVVQGVITAAPGGDIPMYTGN